jgi:16S rRNA (uracil1498-N3)-methyltransferase
MSRFYITPQNWNLDNLVLDEAETHHALGVLRLAQGDKAVVFNGQGAEATVEVVDVGKHSIQLRNIGHSKSAPLRCQITLAQAVPKGKNMELIVQKATELGAAAVVPLLSERTVVHLDGGDSGKKQEKWQATAIEACKQCGQNWLPEVRKAETLKAFFNTNPRFDLMLIASLQPDTKHLKTLLADYQAANNRLPEKVLILVGPEGDFTPAEMALAKSSGCLPITLGPIVLRTETAAIYCMSVLSYELLLGQNS